MSYTVRFRRTANRQIIRWHLPDEVMVEVFLRLREDLAVNPASRLVPATFPFNGMMYPLFVPDRSNRLYIYVFTFHIKYSVDEETLWVMRGAYDRIPV